MIDGYELAETLGHLARILEAETDETGLLQRVVDAAVREIPGAEYAGIMMVTRDDASTPSYTDEVVERVDALQSEVGQGPCLEAAEEHPIVRSDNLNLESRWPEFTPKAIELGVRSILSFQLFVHAGTIGALNLYASQPDAFDTEAEYVGTPLAAHAAVALAGSQDQEGLRIALDSRDVIGQAKGILMERHKVTAPRAFDLLVAASQHTNTKLREIAETLATSGELR